MKVNSKSFRSFQANVKSLKTNEENKNVFEFSFASETPYERWWGIEILSMKDKAMRMERLKNSAPLLFNHNRDQLLGVVEDAWIDNQAYCRVRFSSNPFAQEKKKDMEDGILVNVSFAYEIFEAVLLKEKKDGPNEYLVTDFMPYEISLVTIPADNTVGVGRSLDSDPNNLKEILVRGIEEPTPVQIPSNQTRSQEPPIQPEPQTNLENEIQNNKNQNLTITTRSIIVDEAEILKQERERVSQIRAMSEKHGQGNLAEKFISEGKTAEEFARALVDVLGGTATRIKDAPLDMSEKEKKHYSIARAILAKGTGDWRKAGFELECHNALAKNLGREPSGFLMPTNIRSATPYVAGTAANGGNLVQTDIHTGDFIDVMRNKVICLLAGAKLLTGLQGDFKIPTKTGRSTAYWVTENGSITESEATIGQIGFSPKTLGALSVYSRQFLAQSSLSVDDFITNDLLAEVGLGIDAACLYGTGLNGQPTGVLNRSGINSVSMGTNGGAPTMDLLIDLETLTADANADVASMAYIANARTTGVLKKLKDSQGRYIWDFNSKPLRAGALAPINGYDLFRTNQIPSNLTKGTGSNLSSLIFGDFNQMIISQWSSGIEIEVNGSGDTFKTGGFEVRALSLVDSNIRQPKSFSVVTDLVANLPS